MNSDSENKKPKYFRDGSEPKSKFIRSKDDKPVSKYLRSKEDKEANEPEKGEYRKNVITPKRARELMLEEEQAAEADGLAAAAEEAALTDGVTEENEHKGSIEEIFENGEKEEETKPEKIRKGNVETSLKLAQNQAIIRMVVCMAFLSVISLVLYFFTFNIPYMPTFLFVEFSSVAELIAAIAYGPVFGVLICVIKDIIHMIIFNTSAVSDFTNMLLDSSFVFIAGLLYSRSMFYGDKKVVQPEGSKVKDYRRRRIFTSAFSGAIISAVPQFLITRYIAYPLLERLYSDRGVTIEYILQNYQVSFDRIMRHLPSAISAVIPDMDGISKAIVYFNLPVTFLKLFVVTSITAIVYKWISPFLHYRHKDKRRK